jgi:hypothetical protein
MNRHQNADGSRRRQKLRNYVADTPADGALTLLLTKSMRAYDGACLCLVLILPDK